MGFKEWWKQVLANLFGTWLASAGGAMSGTFLAYVLSAPPWAYALFIIGGITIGFLILVGRKQQGEQVSTGWNPKEAPKDGGLEFFATIDDLRARHPLQETFKPGNEIHAYFLSGEGVFAEHSEYIKCVKRLILPFPDAESLARYKTRPSSVDFITQITRYRAMARKNDINSVRLYKEFTGVSLLFCNPDKQDGWVQVGIVIPVTEPADRQHYRLYKAKHERAFLSLYYTFDKLWNASSQNTAEEDMREGFDSG